MNRFTIATCILILLIIIVCKNSVQAQGLNTKHTLKKATAVCKALTYYPELTNTKIKWKYRKRNSPFAASINLLNIFRKPINRTYAIIVSARPKPKLKSISYDSLSADSKIGVIGHELAHISYFNTLSTWQYIKHSIKNINKYNVDKSEYATDLRSIQHGLGFYLLSWSKEVREKLKINKWGGSGNPDAIRERYMNPETILMHLKTLNAEQQ